MPESTEPKAAVLGEPSYIWRAGQERRWRLIQVAAGERLAGAVLDNGCGVGLYLREMASSCTRALGVEFDRERAAEALNAAPVVNAAGENLPVAAASFDLILSHEVLEHVADDRQALAEMSRVLRPGGRIVLFVPNRGYPFETHGVYWRGTYRFGNIPLVNYLPRPARDRLAPHVRVYTSADLARLAAGLPLRLVTRTILFGAYDNVIARWPMAGRALRRFLQALEGTPLRVFGLSHFWVLERI
ncbi:MAG: methyltransferase domain-containing protein [Oricola sp.]